MGCAHSPSVANLYGAFFEERVVQQLACVLFYVRYIDDSFAIVAAKDASGAVTAMDPLQFHNCQIVWSSDELSQVFLDLTISLNEDNTISFKPYRKPMNTFERIPWASHHPTDVKRGTFIGEMTRLAALSSSKAIYDDALYELKEIYLARGYPRGLVDSWLRSHTMERWNDRYRMDQRGHGSVHVLKSVFNPVWDFVKTADLNDSIMQHWSVYLDDLKDQENRSAETIPLVQTKVTDFFLPLGVKERRIVTGSGLLPPVEDTDLESRPRILQDFFPSRVPVTRAHSAGFSSSGSEGQDEDRDVTSPSQPEGEADTPEEETSIFDLLDRRLVVAKQRCRTLGDVANDWRRSVLAYRQGSDAFPLTDKMLHLWMISGSE